MRVLLANTGHPATIKGGAEAAVLDLARILARRGHEVSLVVHHGGHEPADTVEDGVRVHALPFRNLYFGFGEDARQRSAPLRLAWHAIDGANPWMARAFGRILDRERPDVVNTHALAGLSPLVWRAATTRGVPVVHYLHEYGLICPRASTFRNDHACATPCLSCRTVSAPRRALTRLVDTVVGVSRYTLERHIAWGAFPNAVRAVIPNVFDGLTFHGRRPGRPGTLRLGYFGRIIRDKGVELAIAAIRRLPADAVTLDIAGTGDADYVSSLQAGAPANVRFLGWSRPDAFFPTIDVALVPSIWPDPQPRATFEAFTWGVPVIGSDAGGIPEEIDVGRTGWLFRAGSVDALAETIRRRAEDRADLAFGVDGFVSRLARLDPERVVVEYETVFRAAIARRQAAPLAKPLKIPVPTL